MLIVSQKDRRVLVRDATGAVTEYADLSAFTDYPLNDMVVDSSGRAYIGSFGFEVMSQDQAKFADLYLVDVDGAASVAAPSLYAPNGLLITPDGSTLLANETIGNRISAFDIHADGSLGERRDWARFGPTPDLAPVPVMFGQIAIALDDATLDAEGAVWAANAANRRVVRVREDGDIMEEIAIGDLRAFA
jgi:sugar lactone lactonase YvrE